MASNLSTDASLVATCCGDGQRGSVRAIGKRELSGFTTTAILTCVLLLVANCSAASPAPLTTAPAVVDDANHFGIASGSDPYIMGERDRQVSLDSYKALGATWLRASISWTTSKRLALTVIAGGRLVV